MLPDGPLSSSSLAELQLAVNEVSLSSPTLSYTTVLEKLILKAFGQTFTSSVILLCFPGLIRMWDFFALEKKCRGPGGILRGHETRSTNQAQKHSCFLIDLSISSLFSMLKYWCTLFFGACIKSTRKVERLVGVLIMQNNDSASYLFFCTLTKCCSQETDIFMLLYSVCKAVY